MIFTAKVVAVNNLWLSVAITLGMALVIGLTRPFVQPQLNVLQTACFACASPALLSVGNCLDRRRLNWAVRHLGNVDAKKCETRRSTCWSSSKC